MSIIPPGLSRQLQFYLSGPMPCPYLQGQIERKLFTRLSDNPEANVEVNSILTRAGFRRSHDISYRPACVSCSACVPVRVPVRLFLPSRSQKRVAAHNRDLRVEISNAAPTDELFELFMRYQRARHADSDMAFMSDGEFAQMLQDGEADTRLYMLRDTAEKLVGCIIADPVGDGLSAVYSFFDPDLAKRSLGTQLILTLINECLRERLAHVYLGYWIAASQKMAYKNHFQPLQGLGPQGWDWIGD